MDKRLANTLKISLSALLAAVLVWFSFRGVDWERFRAGMAGCEWKYVVLSMLIGIYSFWIRSRRWRETLLPIDPTTTRMAAFDAINLSYLVNMVIPRGGEIVRCGVITRHSAKDENGQRLASFDKVIGTVLVDRLWDTLVMILILAGIMFAFRQQWGNFLTDKVGAINFSSTYILLVIAGVIVIAGFVCYLFHDRNRLLGKIWDFTKGIFTGVRDSFRMPSVGRFLFFTAMLWLSYWATSATALLSLQGAGLGFENLGALDALFLMSAGSISSVIPVPGGFGAYHYIITLSLSTIYGIPAETGLVFAVLSHESQAIAQILCGGASYVHEVITKA